MDKHDQEQTDREMTEEERATEALQGASEARMEDARDPAQYSSADSMGAAVLRHFGIDPANIRSLTITIETDLRAETISVDLRVKPPSGSADMLSHRLLQYRLVPGKTLDGVPEPKVQHPDGIPMGDNAVKCPECGETGRPVRLDIREGKCYYCRQDEARE